MSEAKPKRKYTRRKAVEPISPNGAQGDPATAIVSQSLGGDERRDVSAPALETKGNIELPPPSPDEPPRDPSAGDKTPALIEWRRKHWPAAAFERVYSGRRIPV
jgi:hypothetical protein